MSKGSRDRTTNKREYERGYDGVRWPMRSRCCGAWAIKVASWAGLYYECSKCGEPCDVKGGRHG